MSNEDVDDTPKDFETVNVPQDMPDPPRYEPQVPSFEKLLSSRNKNWNELQTRL